MANTQHSSIIGLRHHTRRQWLLCLRAKAFHAGVHQWAEQQLPQLQRHQYATAKIFAILEIAPHHHDTSLLVAPLEVQPLQLALGRVHRHRHHRAIRDHLLHSQVVRQRAHQSPVGVDQMMPFFQSRQILDRSLSCLPPILAFRRLVLQAVYFLLLRLRQRVEVQPFILAEVELAQFRLVYHCLLGEAEGEIEGVLAAGQIRGVQLCELAGVCMQPAEESVGLFSALDGEFAIGPSHD